MSLFTTLAEAVMATEPNTLRFHVTEDDHGNVVVMESYVPRPFCLPVRRCAGWLLT